MNNFLRCFLVQMAICLTAVFAPSSPSYAGVTTTLLSEDFYEATYYSFPPSTGWYMSGWNAYYYWYPSPNGKSDKNGSAMLFLYNFANGDYLNSPSIDATAFTDEGENVYVEFDLWWEYDRYNLFYGSDYFYIYADDGYGNLTELKVLTTEKDYTFDNSSSYGYYYDPEVDPGYWRHYKILIPAAARTSNMHVVFYGEAYNAAGGNVGIDNVVVTGEEAIKLSYAPGNLDFAPQGVGTPSAAQCVTLTNESPIDIQILSTEITGPYATSFEFVGEVPTVVPALSSVDVCVRFDPVNVGLLNATLVISNTSDNNPDISVQLIGEAWAASIELIALGPNNFPTTMFRKTRKILGTSVIQGVILKNTGRVDLAISPGTFIDGDFPEFYWVDRLPDDLIPPGKTDTLFVGYSPTREGLTQARLNIVSNAINGTQLINLVGVGTLPRIVVTPSLLHFDSVAVGQIVSKKFTVCNPGSDTLRLGKNMLSSGDPDFTAVLLSGSETIIAPDKCKEVVVTFTPKQKGMRQARYHVVTNIPLTFEEEQSGEDGTSSGQTPQEYVRNDTATNVLYYDITGTGVPVGTLTSADIRGDVGILDSSLIGTEKCRQITITNPGDYEILITSATFTGTAAADYTLKGISLPYTLGAKSSVLINICGTPSTRGSNEVILTLKGTSNGFASVLSGGVNIQGLLACAASTPVLAFENTLVPNTRTDTTIVTVTNCGDVVTTYTANFTTNTDGAYTVWPSTSPAVVPGGTTTFEVYFTPLTSGLKPGMLAISGANVSVMNVDLQGTGACAVLDAPPTVEAPATAANSQQQFTITINNTGNLIWDPGTPVITPPGAFSYVNGGAPISANGSGTLIFSFDPPSMNTFVAQITFPSAGECGNALSIDVTGTALKGSVKDVRTADGYVLEQNMPNPTNGLTSFRYTLPALSSVRIMLADVTGKTVRELVNANVPAGTYQVEVNTTDLASGTYLYIMEAGNARLVRQMSVTK